MDSSVGAVPFQRRVRAHYEAMSELYRTAWGESFHFGVFAPGDTRGEAVARVERLIADAAGFAPGQTVLDVGCGVGGPAATIARRTGARIVGVDLVPDQVAAAQATSLRLGTARLTHFLAADALRLPFADGSFDHVYTLEAGCHMPDRGAFHRECARVLRAEGCFTGIDWFVTGGCDGEQKGRAVQAICRCFACPPLLELRRMDPMLRQAGLTPAVVEDLASHGDVLANLQALNPPPSEELSERLEQASPDVVRALREGGHALTVAARTGTFVVGYWRAYKPPSR